MTTRLRLTLLALVLLFTFALGAALPAPAVGAAAGGDCWTTCCELQPWTCITCCKGQICPDLMCP